MLVKSHFTGVTGDTNLIVTLRGNLALWLLFLIKFLITGSGNILHPQDQGGAWQIKCAPLSASPTEGRHWNTELILPLWKSRSLPMGLKYHWHYVFIPSIFLFCQQNITLLPYHLVFPCSNPITAGNIAALAEPPLCPPHSIFAPFFGKS